MTNPKINASKLVKLGACEEGVDLFRAYFGSKTVSLATVLTTEYADYDGMGTEGKGWLVGRFLPRTNASALTQLCRWWADSFPTVPSALFRYKTTYSAWNYCSEDEASEGCCKAFVDFFVRGKLHTPKKW